ncbi:MAG TPA: choice-of-anchor L domain-containing protein, partial [Flavobacterium sp.]|nr:choice-of-anchor L domain-containing protein [Flavobacterium sp.]
MNKFYVFVALFLSFAGFSQGIQVDTSLTPTQLVNSVLINSPCVSGTNVTASTGTNFGSTNGIGKFVNYNPNFPFASGVVLSTGDVTQAPSPNTTIQSAGSTAWGGDAELESILLSQSGVTFSSINASYLQFQFNPTAASFDFNFIFASEEYGASQCNFSDAFAFILEHIPSGTTQNLAVIAGNTPISVATIRDSANNPNCPSANPSFFGAYNGPNFGPAINFNGQTVQMTASATGLIIGDLYRIKIVIADGRGSADDNLNVGYDSAIFIEGSSFNIGQNILGPDLVVSNNTAVCQNTTYPTLQPTTLPPSGTTYQWLQNGSPIPSATTSSLNLNTLSTPLSAGINTISLVYTQPSCAAITDDIKVEVLPAVNALATVPDQYLCTTPYTFDLTQTTTIISTNNTPTVTTDDLPANTIISYHASQTNADGNILPLGTSVTITQAQSPMTVYVRITNPDTNCYTTRTFTLNAVNPVAPIPTPIAGPLTVCATNAVNNPPRGDFDLAPIIAAALGSQNPSQYVVTFHTTLNGAINSTNLLPLNNGRLIRSSGTIFIRVQAGNNPTCFVTSSIQLIVTPLPTVPVLPDVIVCNSYTLPSLSAFPGAEYRTLDNGNGTVIPEGTVMTPVVGTPITVYLYNAGGGTCPPGRDSFKITKADYSSLSDASACQNTGYTLPVLQYGNYYNGPGGTGGTVTSTTINTVGTTTVYAYFQNLTIPGDCAVEKAINVTIIPFQDIPDQPNIFQCNPYILPPAPAGTSYFDQPAGQGSAVAAGTVYNAGVSRVYLYKETATTPNCWDDEEIEIVIGAPAINFLPSSQNVCTSFTLPPLPTGEYRTAAGSGGVGGGSLITDYNITTTQTIYYHVPGQVCTDNVSFTITVLQTPLPTFANQTVCNVYYLPPIGHTGNYFTAAGGTGTLLPVNYPVISTQTIYVYDDTNGCIQETSFLVTVDNEPTITIVPQPAPFCNSTYTVPDLVNGEFYYAPGGPSSSNVAITPGTVISTPGLTTLYAYNPSASGGCPPVSYSIDIDITSTTVTLPGGINNGDTVMACDDTGYILPALSGNAKYYAAPVDPQNSSASTPIAVGTAIMTSAPIYVYAEDNNRIPCSDQKMFDVVIYPKPVVPVQPTVNACVSYTLPPYTAPVTGYYEQPGGPLTAGNIAHLPGETLTSSILLYAYAASPSTNPALCPDEEPWQINITPAPTYATPAGVTLSGNTFTVDACDSYTLPAPTAFSPIATGYVTTNDGTDPAYGSATVTTLGTTTLYIRTQSADAAACVNYKAFTVSIFAAPVVPAQTTINSCVNYTLPPYTAPVTGYYEQPGGPLTPGNIAHVPGEVLTSSILLYAYAASPSSNPSLCPDEEPWQINITPAPTYTTPTGVTLTGTTYSVDACDSYTLPTVTDFSAIATGYVTTNDGTDTPAPTTITAPGATVYIRTQSPDAAACVNYRAFTIGVYNTPVVAPIVGTPFAACNDTGFTFPALVPPATAYYEQPGGPNTPGNVSHAVGSTITAPATYTFYAYAAAGPASNPNQCYDEEAFTVTISQTPVLTDYQAVYSCDSWDPSAFIAALPANAGLYADLAHTTPVTSPVLASTTLYVYAENPANANCNDIDDFAVTVTPTPVYNAADIATVNACNSYTLPALLTPNAQYYDAINGTVIAAGTTYTAPTTTIYVYAVNGTAPNTCVGTWEPKVINVFNVEEPTSVQNCGSYTLPALTTPGALYYTGPNGTGTSYAGGGVINATTPLYVYAMNPAGTCSDQSPAFTVTI